MNLSMPVLFVGHGSPMNAIEHNTFTREWQEVVQRIPPPRSVLCISAHWETRGVAVASTPRPETIHDFYGFPKSLFDVRYPAPGDPELAQRVMAMVKNVRIGADSNYGLDHGAWSVLRVMYPNADVPVVQLSIDSTQPGAFHHALGRELAPLREDGVLILASGNIVHNLRLFNFNDTRAAEWAARANITLSEHIRTRNDAALLDWKALGADVSLGIPTPEHYLPLLYAVGASRLADRVEFFNDTVFSSLAMTSVMYA